MIDPRRGLWRARALARRVWKTVRTPAIPLEAEMQLPWLRAYGCRTVIDVGANEGQFAGWARAAFPDAQICSFEPLPSCHQILRTRFAGDARFKLFEMALGDARGEVEMFQNDYSPSSSLLEAAQSHHTAFPHTTRATPIRVPVRTLDDVLGDEKLDDPLLLKLDVQGFEARVLAGGTRVLSRAQLVLVELSLEPLYIGEPLFDEVYRWIVDRGFVLRGIVDQLRRPSDRKPLQVDALFERHFIVK